MFYVLCSMGNSMDEEMEYEKNMSQNNSIYNVCEFSPNTSKQQENIQKTKSEKNDKEHTEKYSALLNLYDNAVRDIRRLKIVNKAQQQELLINQEKNMHLSQLLKNDRKCNNIIILFNVLGLASACSSLAAHFSKDDDIQETFGFVSLGFYGVSTIIQFCSIINNYCKKE